MSQTHFPLDEEKLPFSIPKDEKPREKILKLGQKITDRVPAKLRPLTAEDPEYWGLAGIVTDEMADVALKMKVRKPMTLPQLVKVTGKPAQELHPGDVISIPPEVKHWHGAAQDSWFAHVAISVPGSKAEWLEPVADAEYRDLK